MNKMSLEYIDLRPPSPIEIILAVTPIVPPQSEEGDKSHNLNKSESEGGEDSYSKCDKLDDGFGDCSIEASVEPFTKVTPLCFMCDVELTS